MSRRVLTDQDWMTVFRLRCRNRRGETLTRAESALCLSAYKANPERYSAMNDAVLVETAPFGSIQHMTRKP